MQDSIKFKGHYKITLTNKVTGEKKVYEKDNLVTLAGKYAVAKRMANTNDSTLHFSYFALGSSTTAPTVNDLTLGTEIFRKFKTTSSHGQNASTVWMRVETEIDTAEGPNGGEYDIEEIGLFIEGTTDPDSGLLFSRILETISKTDENTLTLEYTLTIT